MMQVDVVNTEEMLGQVVIRLEPWAYSDAIVSLGDVAVSGMCAAMLTVHEIGLALSRHQTGDWGDADEAEQSANDASLENGGSLISKYRTMEGTEFLVKSNFDRTETTMFLPFENF